MGSTHSVTVESFFDVCVDVSVTVDRSPPLRPAHWVRYFRVDEPLIFFYYAFSPLV